MKNYFQASPENSYHISLGAIIFNKDRTKVLCHFIKEYKGYKNLYLLMRETINPNETFEIALKRGCLEEFGAQVEIKHFIGSIVVKDNWFGEIGKEIEVEKTTLYFECALVDQDDSKRVDDGTIESKSELVWIEPEELIQKMTEFFDSYGINNLNESEIIKRVLN
ncbi:NUDIX hydrolase [Candidatus Dojkabacteria bacterium]|uniref:NUDIX hydrolase n=1 Tax=Candidatus Dojkabacteria bacterium TaxID=2099670 RepID=A0A955IAN7_9BACT|nr:NUDIX hydrolase [Candidatus Dojkabacteria bacterium]